MQNEGGLAFVAVYHLLVQVHIIPCLQHIGLSLGQRCTHGEVGLRQIDCCVVILRHFLSPDFIYLSSLFSMKNTSKRSDGAIAP